MLAVFDIDGVVADVRHRLHHLQGRKSWSAFFADAGSDALLPEGARLARDLGEQHDLVWLTGRPERLRDTTAHWLRGHDLPADELFLRGDRDYRPAAVYKLEILARLAPRGIAAFVDDDDAVVHAARQAGYPAVLADWVPRGRVMREAQDDLGRT